MSDLDGRDRSVVQLVARFKQLTSRQIHDVLFADRSSHTPCDRTLRRLSEQKFLNRIERRMVGGAHGGAGQYTYQLGRRGFFMFYTGRYNPVRTVSYHSLALADCYVILKRLERAGLIGIRGGTTEPDCWITVGGVLLKPDMYVDLTTSSGGQLRTWLEMDMATESPNQVKGQLEAYYRAYSDAGHYPYPDFLTDSVPSAGGQVKQQPVFPRVLWVAVDDERAKELEWLIGQFKPEAQILFQVTTREAMPGLFV